MKTTTANMWATVAWINSHQQPENDPLVVFDGIVENVPGRVTARVHRTNRFNPADALKGLTEMFAQHYGDYTDRRVGALSGTEEREWQLTDTRFLRLIGKPGIGTFIQLIDKEQV